MSKKNSYTLSGIEIVRIRSAGYRKVISCAGLLAGLVYQLLAGKSRTLAVIAAGVVAPVVNTGIFLLGCRLFFYGTIQTWATEAGFESAGLFMVTAFVGVNFLVELAVNLVLSSGIVRIIQIATKAK